MAQEELRGTRGPVTPPEVVEYFSYNPKGQKYFALLEKKYGKGKALSVLAAKLGRAGYHMLRRHTPFEWPEGPAAPWLDWTPALAPFAASEVPRKTESFCPSPEPAQ